jgi:hypothetical protein
MLLQVAYEADPLVEIETDDHGQVLQFLEAGAHEIDAVLVRRLEYQDRRSPDNQSLNMISSFGSRAAGTCRGPEEEIM